MSSSAGIVSVIIPCYEQAHFLSESLESVVAQTYSSVEIIVVDDGSTDNIADVVAAHPSVVFHRQPNRGLGTARNAGFHRSNGEFIVFLDADDRLTRGAIESHLACFRAYPEAGFVVGDIDNIALDGSHLSSPRWPLLQGDVYEDLLKVNHVANTIAVMFRRAVIERVGGFKKECQHAEDVELLLHAARLFSSAHHRSTVAQYRRYPNSMSRMGERMLPAIDRVMRLQREIVKDNPRLEKAYRKGDAYWRDYFGQPTLKAFLVSCIYGRPRQAAKLLVVLLRYVGGRIVIWPWKYRRKVSRFVKGHLSA